ncbi:MAG: RNA methyltransferase [Chitinophagales bacterium]
MEKISSIQNPRIKNLKKLDKSSERKAQNLILIEGLREVILAQRAGYQIETVFICAEILKTTEDYSIKELKRSEKEIPVIEITESVYRSVAYRDSTEGILATARPKSHTLERLNLKETPLILVIEAVEKPGNLGAMLRTADAAGADAVIICDPKTEVYNPNVIRSGVGTVFTNQIAICETHEAIRFLKAKKIITYAAELTAVHYHFQKNFTQPTALVVGTEATGLSEEWMTAADEHVKIPMLGYIDSLNVSVSAAVLLFEAVRQRQIQ